MSDLEHKAHDLAVALATAIASAKLNDEVRRLADNGLTLSSVDCGDFLENYSTLYDNFKEELSKKV